MSLNNKPCMVRPFLVDLNPVELKYYPFVISLDSGSFNSVDHTNTSTKTLCSE